MDKIKKRSEAAKKYYGKMNGQKGNPVKMTGKVKPIVKKKGKRIGAKVTFKF